MCVCIFAPVGSDVGSAVVEYYIAALAFEVLPELVVAGRSGDISLEAGGAGDSFDGVEVDSDDGGVEGHAFAGDLHPSSGCGAEIDEYCGVVEEVVFAIELYELIGGSGTISLLLCEVVVGIESLLRFGFLAHGFVERSNYNL